MNLQTLTKFFITATHDNWVQGKITPTWGLAHRELIYKKKPFNDPITMAKWRQHGHYYENNTGDLIDYKDLPPWVLPIAEQTGLNDLGASLFRMTTGCILPIHQDTYSLYKQFHNIQHNRVMRIVVFLEDWQSGHYLEIDGAPITGWSAGDWVGWNYDTPHLAANLGMTDRYTMQITGTYELPGQGK